MSELTLVIGNKNYSSWSLRAWLFLKQVGVTFCEHRIPMDTERWQREIGQYSPSRRVPVLRHGSQVVWDSLAICEYVNERFADGKGWPEEVERRAHARSISAEMHSGFPHLRGELPMNCRAHLPGLPISEAAGADVRRVLEIWRACRERYAGLGPYLFGDFSIADAMFAPVVMRFRTYEPAVGPLETAYMESMMALPALTEWLDAARAEKEIIEAEERQPAGKKKP